MYSPRPINIVSAAVFLYCTALLLLNPSLAHGRKKVLVVDSLDAATHERVRVAKQTVGDIDYHKFGKLIVERKGDHYFITFPLYQAAPVPWGYFIESEIIPAGTKVVLKCGKTRWVSALTDQDTEVMWHYHWHYMLVDNGIGPKRGDVILFVDRSHEGFKFDYYERYNYDHGMPGLFGLNWWVRYEFTHDDMMILRSRKITDAYIMMKTGKAEIPITGRQAAKIQSKVAAVLHR